MISVALQQSNIINKKCNFFPPWLQSDIFLTYPVDYVYPFLSLPFTKIKTTHNLTGPQITTPLNKISSKNLQWKAYLKNKCEMTELIFVKNNCENVPFVTHQ